MIASTKLTPEARISIFADPQANPLGPLAGLGLQLDQTGKVATTLNGVRLHFLPVDAYAPLTFVSGGQINAIVPYEIAGLSTVKVQVEFAGQTSDAFDARVSLTVPGDQRQLNLPANDN